MTDAKHGHKEKPAGYEREDVDARRVLITGLVLVAVTVSALLLVGWIFGLLSVRESHEEPTPSVFTQQRTPPPEPRLQVNPAQDLTNIRQAGDSLLNSYGWVDRQAGTVHLPIERAMDLVAARGLPNWPVTGENALIESPGKPGKKPAPGIESNTNVPKEKGSDKKTP